MSCSLSIAKILQKSYLYQEVRIIQIESQLTDGAVRNLKQASETYTKVVIRLFSVCKPHTCLSRYTQNDLYARRF